jgi:hypothetical protein
MNRVVMTVVLLALAACSGESQPPPGSNGPSLDRVDALRGIPDHGDDPAVVLLDLGGGRSCSGALLEADVVLTARDCVPSPVSKMRVLAGEDRATAVERARGAEAFVPLPGSAGVALVLLDGTIEDITPLTVRTTAPAVGDHLRTVGFGSSAKVVRDHVSVVASGERGFDVSEAACVVASGAPAIDETTGEVVGAMTSGGAGCRPTGVQDDDARVDVALPFVTQALLVGRRATAAHAAKTKKGPIDLGATCEHGIDCAAGVCVTYAGARYCSRTCDGQDRCPSKFRCMQSQQGPRACVEQ